MHNYKNLKIWAEAIEICKTVYAVTQKFPDAEKFGLISQMRRAAVSIASNIAEGSSRSSKKDFLRFLEMAHGSSFEIETQVIIAKEVGYVKDGSLDNLAQKIAGLQRMIFSFKNTLNNEINIK